MHLFESRGRAVERKITVYHQQHKHVHLRVVRRLALVTGATAAPTHLIELLPVRPAADKKVGGFLSLPVLPVRPDRHACRHASGFKLVAVDPQLIV